MITNQAKVSGKFSEGGEAFKQISVKTERKLFHFMEWMSSIPSMIKNITGASGQHTGFYHTPIPPVLPMQKFDGI